jgi:hypothetical protein
VCCVLKTNNSLHSNKALKIKIAIALDEDMKILPEPMKTVLIDDLITVFENRLKVLNNTQVTFNFTVDSREVIYSETF